MTKRLTEKQKEEILKSFKSGTAINDLSQKHNCTHATITRNLKKSLGEFEYKELLNKSKPLKEKSQINKKQNNDLKETNFGNDEFENNFWPSLSTKLANLIPKLSVQNSIKHDNKNNQLTEAKL